MKIAPLSQSCASMSTPKNCGTTTHVNSGSKTAKILSKSGLNNERSLQKAYCLSSACFLGCLALVYSVAALVTSGVKCNPQSFVRII